MGEDDPGRELRELRDLLLRIRGSIFRSYMAVLGMIYLVWVLWLSTMLILMVLIWGLGAPEITYYIILAASLAAVFAYSSTRLPRVILGAAGASGRSDLRLLAGKMNRLIAGFWATGIILYASNPAYAPLVGGAAAPAVGLILMLATGNLGVCVAEYRYMGMRPRGPLATILALYASASIAPFLDPGLTVWVYTYGVLIAAYTALAIHSILAAVR